MPDQPPPPSPDTTPPAAPVPPSGPAESAPPPSQAAEAGGPAEGKPEGNAGRRRKKAAQDGDGTANDGRRRVSPARKLATSLAGVAKVTGADIPAEDRMSPRINVGGITITELARALAMHLRSESLFRRVASGDLVTVNASTGEMKPMGPVRFASWAEQRVTFTKESRDGDSKRVSISADIAARVLQSDIFCEAMRPLNTVNLVRLPAWANQTRTAVKLLPAGYDESTGSFTVDGVPYRTDQEPDEARLFLLDAFKEFPFARPIEAPEQPLEQNRSFAVQMAAMFSIYCRQMLRGGLRPAVAVQANQAGSGKTLLVRMALAPVFGNVTVQAAPRDENELGKLLTATVAAGHEYLCCDNLSGFFASAEMESFLTSPRRRGRILGQSQTVDAENTLSVFITGNGLSISPDLARRCLLCDLWFAGQVSERKLAKPIEEELIASPEARAGFLSAMWSLVDAWNNGGCKRSSGATLASFEGFAGVVGGIITRAVFADPIARPEVQLDQTEAAWLTLFRKVADDLPDGGEKECDWDQMIEYAEELEILPILIPGKEVRDVKTSLGKRAKKWDGREFTDSTGRPFRFGGRHAQLGAKKKIRNLLPAPEAAGDEEI